MYCIFHVNANATNGRTGQPDPSTPTELVMALKAWHSFLLQVGWVKADTKAIQAIHEHVITHNSRVTVSHSDQNTWNLHMKSVTEDDRGGYMCQLNTDPMKSQVIIVIYR